jgi:hypothetical protein
MAVKKAPTIAAIKKDIKWMKLYIGYIMDAKSNGDYEGAAQWANEISAMWATISGQFEEAGEQA